MTMMIALGLTAADFDAHSETIFAFVASKSSRLMPGLRASPAVMMITSEFAVAS